MSHSDRKMPIVLVGLAFLILFAYRNHFQNAFHFDDFNTIVDNPYIHDLRNIPRFFSDASTFSTLPEHYIYRPITSASLALDYYLSRGANPFYFHLSTFVCFELQVVLMVFLFWRIMDAADPHPFNCWVAVAAAAYYGLNPANAETVNYINQRADLFCTLGTVASLLWFIARPEQRKRGWYLIPALLAFFAKPPVLIWPFLFLYTLFFESDGSLDIFRWTENRRPWIAAFRASAPALIVTIVAAIFAAVMTPGTFKPGGQSAILYRLTQPWVALHYFKSFFLPTELSADTDWRPVAGPFTTEAVVGYIFVLALLVIAVRASRHRAMRPVAFGIGWFFLALLPTSLVPLAEVTNDHRMFFPFVGLALAVFWALRLALFSRTARLSVGRGWVRAGLLAFVVVLAAEAAGTYERNAVWRTDESLWRDVTIKSPRNGRGLMNYGLVFLPRGDYAQALSYFERALPFTPNYSTLEINLGVATAGLGRTAEAEQHFHRAIELAPDSADAYFFYGRWLCATGRTADCTVVLQAALAKDRLHVGARDLLARLYGQHRN
jgi:protein O-mannosyl-transferase